MSHPTAHTPEHHDAPDAWHTHTVDEHPMEAHAETLNGMKVFVIGMVGYLLTIACIAVVTVYFVSYKNNDQINFEEYPERSLGEAGAIQKDALDRRAAVLTDGFTNRKPVWTDPEAGRVTISLDQAIGKVTEKYGEK